MPNIIDSIQISSSTFDVRDKSATTVVNLTQEQYDNLPSSAKTANVLYNITDATAGDLSQYWTSAQTQSAITEATSGKADTSYVDQSVSGKVDITTFNTYSGNVETALSGKQDTLISGTNIKTINNESLLGSGNIDIQGGGGGGGITSGEVQTMIDESISGKTNKNDNLFTIRTNVIETVAIAGGANLRIIFAFDIIQNNQIVLSTDTVNGKSSLLSELAALGFDNKIYDIIGVNYDENTSNTSYFGEFLGHKCYAVLLGYIPDFGSITIGLKRNDVYYTLDAVGSGKYNYNYLNNKPTVPTSASQLTNDIGYITSGDAQTQIDNSISGKVDTTTFNTYSGNVETSLSGKQDTLVSGTNIKTINNISILGSGNIDVQGGGGGGKAIEAGRGISITTGETADTVSFNLPISGGSGTNSIIIGAGETGSLVGSLVHGIGSTSRGVYSNVFGYNCFSNGNYSFLAGGYLNNYTEYGVAFGKYNVAATNTPLFSVGNGTSNSARHNAFEIRQNGDIYLSNGTNDVKLQDYIQIKAVKISQSDYDQLQTKDPNTLYIITTT